MEGVCVSAHGVVAFQNEYLFAAMPGKKRCHGQATYARADDDCVPAIFDVVLFVGNSRHVDTVNIILAGHVAPVNILFYG
jgi:hypothetical protein